MITEIKYEQEQLLPVVVDKWVASISEEASLSDVKKSVKNIYELMNEKTPRTVLVDSPLQGILLAYLLRDDDDDNGKNIDSTTDKCLEETINEILEQIKDSDLQQKILENIGNKGNKALKRIYDESYFTLWDVFWGGYYEFGKLIGVQFDEEKYNLYINYVKNIHFIISYKGLCIVSQKPINISWKEVPVELNTTICKENIPKNRILHNESGPAVEYKDGFKIYCLDNILVPKYLVMTPTNKLDVNFFKKEKGADIKALFLKKYGVENLVEEYGKEIDNYKNHKNTRNYEWYKKSQYTLYDMSSLFKEMNSGRYDYLPYIRMKNQTIPGISHLECTYQDNLDVSSKWEKPLTHQPKNILEALQVRNNGIHPEDIDIMFIV